MAENVQKAAAWVYQGVWSVLVRWFRVPEHPPELPAREGETVERFRPALGFLQYLKFWFWIGLTAMDGLFLLAWIGSFLVNVLLGLVLAPVFFAVAVLPDIVVYIALHLRYDTTWYVLSQRSMRIRRGIWTIRETTITFENVQNVKVQQGPLQRYFGIADVIVETAGGGGTQASHEGAGVPQTHIGAIEGVADAARIRDLIVAKVRRSRTAGLGDDRFLPSFSPTPPGLTWTADHVAALRDIQGELAALRILLAGNR